MKLRSRDGERRGAAAWRVVVPLAVAAGLGLLWLAIAGGGRDGADPPRLPLRGAQPEVEEARGEELVGAAAESDGRVAPGPVQLQAEPGARSESSAPDAEGSGPRVRFQVVDAGGAPVGPFELAGASPDIDQEVTPESAPRFARTDDQGRVEVPAADLPKAVVARRPGWLTLRNAVPAVEADPYWIVAAPSIRLAGVVVDEGDRPISGAIVTWHEAPGPFDGFPHDTHALSPLRPFFDKSDATGRFELTHAPGGLPGVLQTHMELHDSLAQRVEGVERTDLVLRLESRDFAYRLHGLVVDAGGVPVAGARLRYGSALGESDAQGQFDLRLGGLQLTDGLLAAVHQERGACTIAGVRERLLAAPDRDLELDVRLAEPLTALAGVLVDTAGTPLVGWTIAVQDPTDLGYGDWPPSSFEALVEGAQQTTSLRRTTDEEGRFELRGLLARDYSLVAYQTRNLSGFRAGPFPAGSLGLRLVWDPGPHAGALRGRVVSDTGEPVAGATVQVQYQPGRWVLPGSSIQGANTVTDGEGRFLLEAFPGGTAELTVQGEGFGRGRYDLESLPAGEELEIVVARFRDVRVDASGWTPRPDAVRFLDPDGEALHVRFAAAGQNSYTDRVRLHAGLSRVLTLEGPARVLQLELDGEELGRVPLALGGSEAVEVIRVP